MFMFVDVLIMCVGFAYVFGFLLSVFHVVYFLRFSDYLVLSYCLFLLNLCLVILNCCLCLLVFDNDCRIVFNLLDFCSVLNFWLCVLSFCLCLLNFWLLWLICCFLNFACVFWVLISSWFLFMFIDLCLCWWIYVYVCWMFVYVWRMYAKFV